MLSVKNLRQKTKFAFTATYCMKVIIVIDSAKSSYNYNSNSKACARACTHTHTHTLKAGDIYTHRLSRTMFITYREYYIIDFQATSMAAT